VASLVLARHASQSPSASGSTANVAHVQDVRYWSSFVYESANASYAVRARTVHTFVTPSQKDSASSDDAGRPIAYVPDSVAVDAISTAKYGSDRLRGRRVAPECPGPGSALEASGA